MNKDDYIREIMDKIAENDEPANLSNIDRFRSELNDDDWKQLVESAALNGLDNLELADVIRMAHKAKSLLRT